MATQVSGPYHPAVGPWALGLNAGSFRSVLVEEAAVAAATTGTVAVIGPSGEEMPIVMTNKEVKHYANNQPHRAANEALKYLRDNVGEDGKGNPVCLAIDVCMTHHGGCMLFPVMQRDPNAAGDQNMYYHFPLGTSQSFDWKAMIHNLPEKERGEMIGRHHVVRCGL